MYEFVITNIYVQNHLALMLLDMDSQIHLDCKEQARQIREIFMGLERGEKIFLGGPPYSNEVIRILKSGMRGADFERERVALGQCTFDCNGNVTGYEHSTILNNAAATKYEIERIGLARVLNYVQLKWLLVDPKHRGTGVADELLGMSMDLAMANSKPWVTDVNSENWRMLKFLERHGVERLSEWFTAKGTRMYRMANRI